MALNPAQIIKFLGGISFPASRDEILERAHDNNAPEDITAQLESLPSDRAYERVGDISRALADRE